MKHVIELHDVTIKYGALKAVSHVSGAFHQGSLTAIAGPNGAGKSSLLKAIVNIVKPQTGKIIIAPDVKNNIAYLPQMSGIQRDFPMNVEQAVCTGFWGKTGNTLPITANMRALARQALTDVDLQDLARRQIGTLSGGQFQRLLFARVIVQNAPVILLDEPFAAVDAETTARLINIILNWHNEGRTVICVLHDLLLIKKYFPDSFILAGKCMGHGHTHHMLEKNLLSFDLDMAELRTKTEEENAQND